jgi:glyoxylase-like metal-dependent hydrolase (beta-lactamase superfamily II)
MNNTSYKFKTGDFDCWVINDGVCYPPDSIKKVLSKENQSGMDSTVLLVKTPTNNILFDSGWGTGAKEAPQAGLLIKNLETTGIKKEEIDRIIFSHAHVDHIGGHIDASGKPVFPNARYYMFRKEWEFWTSHPALSDMPEDMRRTAISAVQKNLIPIKDRINLFDDRRDIVPGISYMETPGHSPGHIIAIISSGSQRLLCFFDAFHSPKELENPSLFFNPPMTGEAGTSREKILSEIRPGDLIYAGHFPFPGLGHVVRKDNTWSWQPIAIR